MSASTRSFTVSLHDLKCPASHWNARFGAHPLIDYLSLKRQKRWESRRVVQRSHLTPEAVKKIISTQATIAQRLDAADDVIENVGTFEILKASVLKLHAIYLFLSRKSWTSDTACCVKITVSQWDTTAYFLSLNLLIVYNRIGESPDIFALFLRDFR